MTSTTFQGPVQTGQDTGAPATTTIGTLVAAQAATVAGNTSGASSIVLPANSKISDWTLEVLVSASGLAAGMLVRVGTTTDATRFGQINSSAQGVMYRPGIAPNLTGASAAAWNNIGTNDQRLFIDVTAQASGTNTGGYEAIFTVYYIQR